MIKIIKPGRDLNEIIYVTTCSVCGCEFKFDSAEIKKCNDNVVEFKYVNCPHCNTIIQDCYWRDKDIIKVRDY